MVDPLLERAHAEGETLVAIANGEGLLYAANLPELPEDDVATVRPLPHVVPFLAATQRMLPHVVVATDRIGAELVAVLPAGADQRAEVTGNDQHITRSAPGVGPSVASSNERRTAGRPTHASSRTS